MRRGSVVRKQQAQKPKASMKWEKGCKEGGGWLGVGEREDGTIRKAAAKLGFAL